MFRMTTVTSLLFEVKLVILRIWLKVDLFFDKKNWSNLELRLDQIETDF